MDIEGTYKIGLARQQVWDALQNADVLQQCIPGCQELELLSDNRYLAKVVAAIGPVKATFNTNIEMQNFKPPESYTLIGEAKSGAAGFGKGSADISLTESGDFTTLHYKAHFKVGGKLAQVGSRLVAGVTRKMADEFFGKFSLTLDYSAERVVSVDDEKSVTRRARYHRFLYIAAGTTFILYVLWLLS